MSKDISVYIYIYMSVCLAYQSYDVPVCVGICMYVCMYVRMYVRMCVCTYVSVCVYIYIGIALLMHVCRALGFRSSLVHISTVRAGQGGCAPPDGCSTLWRAKPPSWFASP